MVAVALAGPGMNLALAALAAIGLGIFGVSMHGAEPTGLAAFILANLLNFLAVNVFLALFNLLPIPPFDGGHVVEGVLPRPLAARYARLGQFGLLLLIGVLVLLPMLSPRLDIVGRLIAPPAQALIGWFLTVAGTIAG